MKGTHNRADGSVCPYLAEVVCDKCGWCDPEPERVWQINGEQVDPYALEPRLPLTTPHVFKPGNQVVGCVLCGTTRKNPVHAPTGAAK